MMPIEVHQAWPCAITDRGSDFVCEACLRLCCPCFGGDDEFECLCDECWCFHSAGLDGPLASEETT